MPCFSSASTGWSKIPVTTKVTNEVHDLLEKEASNKAALMNGLGVLSNKYGDALVNHTLIECARIAYLRIKHNPPRSF